VGVSPAPAPLPLPDPMPRHGRIALRAWQPGDAGFLAVVLSDDHLRRFISGLPTTNTIATAEAWIAGQDEARQRHERLDLAVVDAVSGRPIGAVGLTSFDTVHRRAELGCWTAPEERRRGVASRALPMLARWAFTELGIERLALLVEPVNMGSIRVAESIGAVQEGMLRDHSLIAGQRRDVLIYGLLPDELR
jgi:[ribosomal protein S5]-alanine N-acetyltransferase